jgi:hypothetical protein
MKSGDAGSVRRALALAIGLGLAGLAPGATANTHQVVSGDITVHCPMTVGGSFQAKSTAIAGAIDVRPGQGAVGGSFQADLSTLDTGIDQRNQHLRENYLEVAKGEGFAHATLTGLVLDVPDAAALNGKAPFKATFQVHGQARDIAGTAEVAKDGDGYRVVATFPLHIPDFAIPKPRYLGVGVKDDIKVEVSLKLAPVAAGAGQ